MFPITDRDLECFTEVFSTVPFLNEESYQKVVQAANSWNEGLYSKLFLTPSIHSITSNIRDADIAIIPFKFNNNDERIRQYCELAKDKRVVCFYNDDSSEVFTNLPDNLVLFRTSLYKSKKLFNERAMPVLVPDHFPLNIRLKDAPDDKSISFCGYVESIRQPIIQQIKNTYEKTNFIERNGFFAPHLSKISAKKEFYSNLLSSSFALCIRGNGNFSYRFYEALSYGRIPILINTDCALPYESSLDWNKYIINIEPSQIHELPERISSCSISPKNVRVFWETFLSPEGYFNNFVFDLL